MEEVKKAASEQMRPRNTLQHNVNRVNDFSPNLKDAQKFLSLIAPDATITFQTFSDRKSGSYDTNAKILHGSFEDHREELVALNQRGSGIFFTVNKTDGKGRKSSNIQAVRAVFVDLDGAPLTPVKEAQVTPHIIIESSPGRYHAYWLVHDLELEHFTKVQTYLAKIYDGDPQVKDLSRVMRLPGFLHQKKDPFVSKIIEINSIDAYRGSFFVSEADKYIKIPSPPRNKVKENKNDNKILEAIYNHGLFRSAKTHPKGCYDIKCPWEKDHTSSNNRGNTKYFEPHKDGYDSHGFKCFHNHCRDKNINDLCSFFGLTIYQHLAQPTPLFRKVPDPMIFPVEALGVRLSAACRDLNEVVQAPMTICAQSLLSATALVTQPFYNIIIDGRSIPLSLFFITVGESGERKTGIDKVVLHTIKEYQKMILQIYHRDMYQFKNQYDAWSHKRDKAVKVGNVLELEEAPKPPLDPIMLLAEPTFPSLVIHLSKSTPSIGLFSDEGGRFIGGHAMREENVLSTAAGLSALWDAGEIDRARVKDGVYNLYGKRLSLSLMIQPIVAQQIFANPILIGQGFLSRCLISHPKSTIGSRSYKSENIYFKPGFKNFKDRVVELMDRSLPVSLDNTSELRPVELSLSQESCNRWIEFHNQIEYEMRPNGTYEQIKAVAAKIAENALRIAGILSVFEYINPSEVKIMEIDNAIKICEFYLSESLRFLGLSQIDQELVQANKLLEWLHEKNIKRFPTIMIYQKGPNSIRSKAVAKKLLNILKSHGWIIGPAKGEIDNIKHKEVWILR